MRKILGAAAVLAIALPALAQTTPPGPPANPHAPPNTRSIRRSGTNQSAATNT